MAKGDFMTAATLKRLLTKPLIAQACLLYAWSDGKMFPLRPGKEALAKLPTFGIESRREFNKMVRTQLAQWQHVHDASHAPLYERMSYLLLNETVDGKEMITWVANPFAFADWKMVEFHIGGSMTLHQFTCKKLSIVLSETEYKALYLAVSHSANGAIVEHKRPIRLDVCQQRFTDECIRHMIAELAKFEVITRGGPNAHGYDGSVWHLDIGIFDAVSVTHTSSEQLPN